MKNFRKHLLASVSLTALAAGMAACADNTPDNVTAANVEENVVVVDNTANAADQADRNVVVNKGTQKP
jgi:hypothetical protein